MYSLKILEKNDISDYESLADADLRLILKKYDQDKNIAIGARNMDKVLGFVYGRIFKPENEAPIIGINLPQVDTEYRNQVIGTALLQKMEEESRKRECEKMSLDFKYVDAEFEVVKELLLKCGWESPVLQTNEYQTTVERFFNDLPWTKLPRKYPYHACIFPWDELSEGELQKLREEKGPDSWKAEGFPPSYFDIPFTYEKNTSLGLRMNGEVAGWLINKQMEPDRIIYDFYFVRKKYRGLGLSIGLLLESIRRQRETVIPKCVWYVKASDKKINKFYQKLLGPCIMSKEEYWHSSKELTVQKDGQEV